MEYKILLTISVALTVFAIINGAVYAQETTRNTTTTEEEQAVEPEVVGTGQEAVPVITANGTEVAQAAPAESINSLLTTIFTVAIPAVTGLIIAILSLVKGFSKDKKVNEAADAGIAGAKMADTMAPKINDQYVISGAFAAAFNVVADTLESLKAGTKTKIATALEPVPDIEQKIHATSLQINKLRESLPKKAIADNDKSIGNLDKS